MKNRADKAHNSDDEDDHDITSDVHPEGGKLVKAPDQIT
jgi:hypothetical protein